MNPIRRNQTLAQHLEELHAQSDAESFRAARAQFRGTDAEFAALAARYASLPPLEQGALLEQTGISIQAPELSLAVSAAMGEFLFQLTVTKRITNILELGSSRGTSTLYFAEALRLTGGDKVVATELEATKCRALLDSVAAMGLSDYVELHQGDVFSTIENLQGPFGLIFIDIWASGYLDAFQLVERLLTPGTVILADNMLTAATAVRPFKEYLDRQDHISNTTLPFESGVEFAVVLE